MITSLEKRQQCRGDSCHAATKGQGIFGAVDRISPEAPVPVVHVQNERAVPGGACNVALNVATLGAKARLVGCVGDDLHGTELLDQLRTADIGVDGVLRTSERPTTVKTRVIADRQQICRIDREPQQATEGIPTEALREAFAAEAQQAQAIILEDYGKGVMEQPLIDAAREGLVVPATSISINHGGRGQNVLRTDGAIMWLVSPVVGPSDNIWLPDGTNRLEKGIRPTEPEDVFLTH